MNIRNKILLILWWVTVSSTALMAQCIKGNCKNGVGVYIYPSGAKYIGQFKQGKINGKGTLEFSNGDIYKGQWQNQYRQGKGELIFASGGRYDGEFNKSKFEGKGIMTYKGGDIYDGQWSNNKAEGQGEYLFHFGDRFAGNFKEGKFHGEGIYFFKDGSQFKGSWISNQKHGRGQTIDKDGVISLSNWINGEEQEDNNEEIVAAVSNNADDKKRRTHQKEKLNHSASTSKLIDCNKQHCNDLTGVYNYEDGSRYEGPFSLGLPNGLGTCYYANGDKYVGGWRHHTPHGDGVMYFASGRVYGAHWKNGKPLKEMDFRQEVRLKKNILKEVSEEIKVWAVIIGIARYEHMPSLKYTDDDAYRMYAFLKSPEGGALPDNQINILIDEQASRANIIEVMENTFLRADENDVVLLYYSGHGLEGSFIPIDYNGYENKLHHDDIKFILDQSSAKHKVCLADACHSGSFASRHVTTRINDLYSGFENANNSTAFMMSSASKEVSLEGGGLRQGIFTHYLLRGLKGEADQNNDKIVSISELYKFVHREVRIYTANDQTPMISGRYDAKMPISVVR